jgi:hypothetical protein
VVAVCGSAPSCRSISPIGLYIWISVVMPVVVYESEEKVGSVAGATMLPVLKV